MSEKQERLDWLAAQIKAQSMLRAEKESTNLLNKVIDYDANR